MRVKFISVSVISYERASPEIYALDEDGVIWKKWGSSQWEMVVSPEKTNKEENA